MSPTDWSPDSYTKALNFAARAHRGQTLPGSDMPYVVHLCLVAMEVIAALGVEEGCDGNLAIQCALLHDVIEDTGVTYDQVSEEFGPAVAKGVLALSKDSLAVKPLRMKDSLERIRQQPPEVWMVKLADRITNLQRPPSYWARDRIENYQTEAWEILDALGEASDYLAARLREKAERYGAYA